MWVVLTGVYFEAALKTVWFTSSSLTINCSDFQNMWKCLCSLFPLLFFFPPLLAVLGCQAILVSDRNKSFRRGSVGQPLSPTKSSRIRSQRPLSPQPAGLGEIYCEQRKKVVISWHFHDETWPKLCWLGGLKAHKECGCVWPSPLQSCHHWLTQHPLLLPGSFPLLQGITSNPSRRPGFTLNEKWPLKTALSSTTCWLNEASSEHHHF